MHGFSRLICVLVLMVAPTWTAPALAQDAAPPPEARTPQASSAQAPPVSPDAPATPSSDFKILPGLGQSDGTDQAGSADAAPPDRRPGAIANQPATTGGGDSNAYPSLMGGFNTLWHGVTEGEAAEVLGGAGELFQAVWEAELFQAGDTTIKLNQLVIALLIVLIGLYIAKRLTRIAQRRLTKVSKLDAHAATLIQKLLYYLLVMVVVLIALPIAGIPITIFTVLGGAVAIGLGFGAQNLFNNLISGLIIMTERPIRVGDIVEINDTEAKVQDIGNRCTRVRRFDGIDVLVPNSQFLEQPVVNWTLFDSAVRGAVVVGIAYGSPTERARDLIQQAADEHKHVNRKPEPAVLFEEFGDNSLNFRLLFWTNVTSPIDRRRVESDLRYRIDAMFREAGIVIAFPQRDVHLDSLSPVQVKLVDPPPEAPPPPEEDSPEAVSK